jgi:hypothetical protein
MLLELLLAWIQKRSWRISLPEIDSLKSAQQKMKPSGIGDQMTMRIAEQEML